MIAAGLEWVDRKGPIGSHQESAWHRLHSTARITERDQIAAIKAVLRSLSDYPEQLTTHETADDGAPALRDEMVSRAEVLCALSRLSEPEQGDALLLLYRDGLSYQAVAMKMHISQRTLQRRLAEVWPLLIEMIFDYTPD